MNIKKPKTDKGILTDYQRNPSYIKNPIVRYTIIETPKAGYGHCHSCDCKGYVSKHNGTHECKVCNHHYDRHN